MALVKAKWVGPSGYAIQAGTVDDDGTTVWLVPEYEARVSDNWEPLEQPSPQKTSDPGSGGNE